MSVKYGVSTVLLHAAANRIRKGWRVSVRLYVYTQLDMNDIVMFPPLCRTRSGRPS